MRFFDPSLSPRFRSRSKAVLLAGGLLTLTACGPGAVHVQPAEDAANPACAAAMVAMPEELAGFKQRETTAQATTAWGDPATVILKCGVQVPEPVSDPCVSVNGVDWIVKPAEGNTAEGSAVQEATGTWTATSFGRFPNVQVTFNADEISSSSMLVEIDSAVSQLEQVKQCANIDDTLNL